MKSGYRPRVNQKRYTCFFLIHSRSKLFRHGAGESWISQNGKYLLSNYTERKGNLCRKVESDIKFVLITLIILRDNSQGNIEITNVHTQK